ncbi:MAG: cell envelope integrity protein TolA [Roseateles sp.]|uniref:cell envelope integrity protein TolA n=1 Tax=Roseateles sp. TaxID=1971397 RepID=UPI0040369237
MTTAALRPPETAGLGRGIVFALCAHGLLILALTYGLNWRSDASPAFEAELWSAVPQVAAPREEAPPEPEPEPPKPDMLAQQRAAEEAAAEQREAEIAIAKAKKLKEDKAREEAEKRERDKAAKDKAAKDKAAREKADKEEQDRKKAKAAKEADARREALRQENLRRIHGMAGGTPGSTGAAAQNSAPSSGYAGRIKGKIRPLIIYAEEGAANPTAEVQVTLGPDGRILGTRLLKPSGDGEWDRAVLRAIDKAETLPRDVDGRVPPVLILTFRPRE